MPFICRRTQRKILQFEFYENHGITPRNTEKSGKGSGSPHDPISERYMIFHTEKEVVQKQGENTPNFFFSL